MKTKTKLMALTGLVAMTTVFSGCFGYFGLTRRLYEWHSDLFGDNLGGRFGRTVLFFVLSPVYSIVGFIDYGILNLIEFWTGENPLAMNEGDKEIKTLVHNGIDYRMEVTKNQYKMEVLSGPKKGEVERLVFEPTSRTWEHYGRLGKSVLAEYSEDFAIITINTTKGPVVLENNESAINQACTSALTASR